MSSRLEESYEKARKAIDELATEIAKELIANSAHFISIDTCTPLDGQAVWVRHKNGAEYRMTYPFSHSDYPLWYPLPQN